MRDTGKLCLISHTCESEVTEGADAGLRVEQKVGRFNVTVYDTPGMNIA